MPPQQAAPPTIMPGAIPPTTPVQAPSMTPPQVQPQSAAPLDPDMDALMRQTLQTGMQSYGQHAGTASSMIGQTQPIIAQQSEAPPAMAPHIQRGAGILHNIGQALLMAASATAPGRAAEGMYYGSQGEQYRERQAARVKRVEELQKGAATESELAGQGANLAYRPYGAVMSSQRNAILKDRADTYAQSVANRYSTDMKGLGMKATAQDIQRASLALRKYATDYKAMIEQRGQDLGLTKVEMETETAKALGNLNSQAGVEKSSPWLSTLIPNIVHEVFRGDESSPLPAPQIPSGEKPTPSNWPSKEATPTPSKSQPKAEAAPARPAGVPAGAKWNPQTKTWQLKQ